MSEDSTTFIERILERGARVIAGGQLHPAEILAEVEDAARRGLRDGVMPNQFVISFNEADFTGFTPALPGLRNQIERLLDRIEAREGYTRLGHRLVQFQAAPGVRPGDTGVSARFADMRHRPPTRAAAGVTQRLQRQLGYALVTSEGERIELTHTPFAIGRSSGNDLVLANLAVSRAHARIIEQDGGLVIEDLGSRNGVFVDRERVTQAPLTPGQVIRIGDLYLWLERRP